MNVACSNKVLMHGVGKATLCRNFATTSLIQQEMKTQSVDDINVGKVS